MIAFGNSRRGTLAILAVAAAIALTAMPMAASAAPKQSDGPTPIVLFPAWHFTRLEVTVKNQRVDPACPRSGTFEDLVFFDPGPPFSQVCRDKLLTLRYDPNPHKPMRLRFSEQRGVTVKIADYGLTASAPGLRADVRGARGGRLHPRPRHPRRRLRRPPHARHGRFPPALQAPHRGHVPRERPSSRSTSSATRTGPIYVQYLLTHTSQAWKDKYIHGFTPLAGNFPGQGLGYALMFVGINISDLTFPVTPENGVSSARMFLSHPSTFITASDPEIFGDDEIIIRDQSTGADYTPEDYPALFDDAGLSWANPIADYYIGGVPFADRGPLPECRRLRREGLGARDARRARPRRSDGRPAGDRHDRVLHPRRRHQPGGHHERRRGRLGRDGLPPLQPDRQSRASTTSSCRPTRMSSPASS